MWIPSSINSLARTYFPPPPVQKKKKKTPREVFFPETRNEKKKIGKNPKRFAETVPAAKKNGGQRERALSFVR